MESRCWYDVDDMLDGKETGGERISWVRLRRREMVEGCGVRGV